MRRIFVAGLALILMSVSFPAEARQAVGPAFRSLLGTVEQVQDVIAAPDGKIVRLDSDDMSAGNLTQLMNSTPGTRLAQAVIVRFDSGERMEIIVPPGTLLAVDDRVNCLARPGGWGVERVEQAG
nr:hypothetical protein [uncultured Hyphomonas sp.]